jgi:hypothetical protein
MNRSDFLKTLGLGAGGLILLANSFINTQSIKIYDNYVRGLNHYHFHKIRDKVKKGDAVKLLREPTNNYDSFAIQVNFGEFKLGYIAAFENIVMANMLDSGVKLSAFISKKDLKRDVREWLAVEIFAELVIPSQKLINSMLEENRADDAVDIYRKGNYS